MVTINPQYITDQSGKKTSVILTINDFEAIMEELEDMEDIRLYDEAKKNDTGERIPMTEAFKLIEDQRNNHS